MPSGRIETRPSAVYIAGQSVEIEIDHELRGYGVAGTFEFQTSKISLDGTLNHEAQKATMIHEVVHAIDIAAGTRMKERDVCAFASILFAFIRDNRQVMDWIKEGH